jgi:hypothetical protein
MVKGASDVSLFRPVDFSLDGCVVEEVEYVRNMEDRRLLPEWNQFCVEVFCRLEEKDDICVNISILTVGYVSTQLSDTLHELLYIGVQREGPCMVTFGHSGTALYTADNKLHSFIKGGAVDVNGSHIIFLTPASLAMIQLEKIYQASTKVTPDRLAYVNITRK